MGKATRWLKGLLGMKKEKENVGNSTMVSTDKKEKKRWSFAKSGKVSSPNSSHVLGDIPVKDTTAWLRSYMSETEKEQNKHAIAVAAATAAAADAAVAAAQAAAAVVRLTSNGRETLFHGGSERWAAVKIQTVFRGFLARKALRALKSLVKLQALVRGYLVRKRTAATLHSMQVLVRAQNAVRSHRARCSVSRDRRCLPDIRGRRSMERFDETRSEFHSKRISTSYDAPYNTFDESPKIVEMDTCRPRSRSRRINIAMSEYGEDPTYQYISSPNPCLAPSRHLVPECRQYQDSESSFTGDECKFSTTHNTPRFANCMRSPATPSKSVCGDGYFKPCPNSPSYMANTQSFRAKLRSLSAPKQRPEGSKKRLSLTQIMAARTSMSGVRIQRSGSRFQESRIPEM